MRRLRPAHGSPMSGNMASRDELLADLLMAAAFADCKLEGKEYPAVRRALAKALGSEQGVEALTARLSAFRPGLFDLGETVRLLELETDEDKRLLLELVASIHAADEVLDLDEDAFLRRLAELLALPPALYADLVIQDLAVESVRGAWDALRTPPGRRKPPPLPGAK